MCGRFTLRTLASILIEHFLLASAPQLAPRYNIAPTQNVAVVRGGGKTPRQMDLLRWGLIPSWAKDPAIGARMINARAETVAKKPSFRAAFRRRRCLVVADGYYEWQKVGKQKQPYFIHRDDDRPLAFAGLWESWSGPDRSSSEPLETCTIITTVAAGPAEEIHDRMPVIIEPSNFDLWLDNAFQDRDSLTEILKSYRGPLQVDPVSTLVNSPKNDTPQCIEAPRELF